MISIKNIIGTVKGRLSLAIHVLRGRGLIYNVTLDKKLSLAQGQRNMWIHRLTRVGGDIGTHFGQNVPKDDK